MAIPYFQVDAFTQRLFAGNPAGVCLLADWLPDEQLKSIAAENNLAETAFVVQGPSNCLLRWFTPAIEIDLCGHATLAAAHVLFSHLGYQKPAICFQTRSGELTVTRHDKLLTLDFPTRAASKYSPPPELLQALGREPTEVLKARDILAVFEDESTVQEIQPDMELLKNLDCLGTIISAPGDSTDFVSRFFAPAAGVPEDPVTGSAHCTLIPYWSQRLKKKSLRARQISPRGGELFCEDRGDRVGISGHAMTYATGYLHV